MTDGMSGYRGDAPWMADDVFAQERYERDTFDEARLNAEENFTPREPTEAELAAMNAEPLMSAHEEDAVHFGPMGDKIVQVRIAGAPAKRTYAYAVPREVDAAIGDWVSLPGNVVNEHGGFGVVKGFGRQGYNGPLKNIVAVIPEPHELEIRMSVVKTKDTAAKIYDQAVALGWRGEQLASLAQAGQDRLKARGVR